MEADSFNDVEGGGRIEAGDVAEGHDGGPADELVF